MFKNIKLIFLCSLLVSLNTTKNLNSTEVEKESDIEQELSQLSYDKLKELADKSEQIAKILKNQKDIQDLKKIEKFDTKQKIAWLSKANNILFHNVFFDGVGLGIKEILKMYVIKTGTLAINTIVIFYFVSRYTGIPVKELVSLAIGLIYPGKINPKNVAKSTASLDKFHVWFTSLFAKWFGSGVATNTKGIVKDEILNVIKDTTKGVVANSTSTNVTMSSLDNFHNNYVSPFLSKLKFW